MKYAMNYLCFFAVETSQNTRKIRIFKTLLHKNLITIQVFRALRLKSV
jgi:hypothetical protein